MLDMMGNAMKTPALNPGEPVYIGASRLSAVQLEEQLK
jgi:hypothetical protein